MRGRGGAIPKLPGVEQMAQPRAAQTRIDTDWARVHTGASTSRQLRAPQRAREPAACLRRTVRAALGRAKAGSTGRSAERGISELSALPAQALGHRDRVTYERSHARASNRAEDA